MDRRTWAGESRVCAIITPSIRPAYALGHRCPEPQAYQRMPCITSAAVSSRAQQSSQESRTSRIRRLHFADGRRLAPLPSHTLEDTLSLPPSRLLSCALVAQSSDGSSITGRAKKAPQSCAAQCSLSRTGNPPCTVRASALCSQTCSFFEHRVQAQTCSSAPVVRCTVCVRTL